MTRGVYIFLEKNECYEFFESCLTVDYFWVNSTSSRILFLAINVKCNNLSYFISSQYAS